MTPEGKVKHAVDNILKSHKVWYFKPVSMGYGAHGIPDYICCVNGWFLSIECKGTDNAKPTELQEATMAKIEQAGGMAIVIKPNCIRALDSIIVLMKTKPRS